MDTIYMIVTRDRYRLPVCWGSTVRELADRAGIDPKLLYSAMWHAERGKHKHGRYEVVRIPDDEEE